MFDILCTHFPSCSGCVYKEAKTPDIFESAKQFFKEQGIDLELQRGAARGWRMRAKLSAVKEKGLLLLGLYKEGTHEVYDIPECQVHHPSINEATKEIKALFLKEPFSVYDERLKCGDLKYIQLLVDAKEKKVSLSFVLFGKSEDKGLVFRWQKVCEHLKKQKPELWHSFWLNFNPVDTNTILGKNWLLVTGDECVWHSFSGLEVPYGPSHFGQSNLEMFEVLLKDLNEALLPSKQVVEFYAGMGVIGLFVAGKSNEVILSERESSSKIYFEKAREKLPYSIQKRVQFRVGKAEDERSLMQNAEVVIVDPPRKGLHKAFLDELCESKKVEQLVYVSCNFSSFERDTKEILLRSDLQLVQAKAYLFFPGTNHIEVLAIFERKSG